MIDWPASNDYTIAIQSPGLCFRDPELAAATLERTAHTGMPKVWTGNFAQVYAVRNRRRWAVKCFTRSAADIQARYRKIAAAIARSRLPCFVEFNFLDAEMLVNGHRFPVVKMQWADGQPLDEFIVANLGQPNLLLETAARLRDLVAALERKRIAHGDLQHGNILVTPDGVRLLDYDGLFVPAFAGAASPETGVPAYQHPLRTASDYGIGLDRFAMLVICTGLSALASEPRLWEEFNTGDNLLFTGNDFRNVPGSAVFRKLGGLPDPQVRALLAALTAACTKPPLAVPFFNNAMSLSAGPRHGFWWVASNPLAADRATRSATGSTARVAPFRPVSAVAVAAIAAIIAVTAARAGSLAAMAVGVTALTAYLIVEFGRFNELPEAQRRVELSSAIARLERELTMKRPRTGRIATAAARLRRRSGGSVAAPGGHAERRPLVGIRIPRRRTAAVAGVAAQAPAPATAANAAQPQPDLSAARREFAALDEVTFGRYLRDSLSPPPLQWWPRLPKRRR